MSLISGLYEHVKSGRQYYVIGLGRLAKNPEKQVVIFHQIYMTKLPTYSICVRDYDDFITKFEIIK
jgi:hypothetical protein